MAHGVMLRDADLKILLSSAGHQMKHCVPVHFPAYPGT